MLFGTHLDWPEYAASLGLLALAWIAVATVQDDERGQRRTVTGALVFLAALGLARNAAGGSLTAIGVVALLPVLFVALHVRNQLGL